MVKNRPKDSARLIMDPLNDFFIRLSNILKEDRRYKEESYLFVMAALGRALRDLAQPRHISGSELLKSIQFEAKEQFGPMATAVFHYWGIKNSLDFGVIVFNMVREGIFSKTECDRLDDFDDSIFFENLFDQSLGYRLNSEDSILDGAHSKILT